MDTSYIVDFASRDRISDALTDLLRTGAQQLIALIPISAPILARVDFKRLTISPLIPLT